MFKKYIILFCLSLTALLSFGQEIPPKSKTLVTDYTNTLSAEDKQRLEDKLVAFNDSSSTQVAVVMMRSVGDYDIGEYAIKLGRAWGIGQKDKNNGVLILVAKDDRKLTIQTGYGVEGALPDAVTRQIRENDINPRFREGDFYGGLNAGVDQIIKYTKGEYKAEAKPKKKNGSSNPLPGIAVIVIIIVVLIFVKRGGGGGGGSIIDRRGSASPFWWFLAGNMLGGGGRSNGGDWGGFSGGGGGSGGGGFGGFGGGSFGGGGSSGSW
ncbi:TPM domain-containing protein [Mucilaginibacter sp. UR6-1]|uniref:TPM domain-containing protein n=1 Tax=Mucilaginibacter sp. UR6-1 TaxID=1435643 RepID=UPI001E65075D|nr:TPM domain-containing protein [Mucilaginibacter sp. UR6-1]MCC8410309.1 TPM domain-containing protein [Mucilaginibacter sp. UR6-1]